MIWNSRGLAEALSIKVKPGFALGEVQFNSKDVKEGDLFIALKGERDGHEFVLDALAKGAGAAIVSKTVEGVEPSKLIIVKDCAKALEDLAEYKRLRSRAKFIGITGSVGKTSTKEVVRLMLSVHGKTFASRGTFNNYLGVPLNLASIPDDAEFVIMEMGMNAAGEIHELARLVWPDIALIASIAPAHIEFFESVEAIADAKCEIFDYLDPKQGVAILNRDTESYQRCLDNIHKLGINNLLTFGSNDNPDIKFAAYEVVADNKVRLVYEAGDKKLELTRDNIAKHLAANFAASLAVALALGLNLAKSLEAAGDFEPMLGRGKVIEVNKNGKKIQLICDYYNSNPASLTASLKNLGMINHQTKLAIIGDMRELGKQGKALHQSIVPFLIDAGVKKVLLVGQLVKAIWENLPSDIEASLYDNVEALLEDIDNQIIGGEMVLIKGSKSIQLHKVAEYLGVENAI